MCLEENPDAEQATIQELALCNRLGEIAEAEITHHEHKKTWALRWLVFTYWIFCGTRNAWEWDVERIREERRREQEGKGYSSKLQPKSRVREK
ncbi:hypothetical protein N7513_013331 [Penicillium frequentans]|nr:hypothetical protein N7513_013331 [Penicillium glabrum]